MPRRQPVTTAPRPVRSNMVRSGIAGRPGRAVDEHLHHAAAFERRECRRRVVDGYHLGDERLGGDVAGVEQLYCTVEVVALVDAGANQRQLAPEELEQVDLPWLRVDRDQHQA